MFDQASLFCPIPLYTDTHMYILLLLLLIEIRLEQSLSLKSCIKHGNFTQLPGEEILCMQTVFAEVRVPSETVRFHQISIPGNQVKFRYFRQWKIPRCSKIISLESTRIYKRIDKTREFTYCWVKLRMLIFTVLFTAKVCSQFVAKMY